MVAFRKLRPAVSKQWLFALAGFMWSTVGLMLCRQAYGWLAEISLEAGVILGALGMGMAMVAYGLGFSKVAQKNIQRLDQVPPKVCIFAFQAWRGYITVGFMIGLGIVMRNSPVPKPYLAILYLTIGGALVFASFHYYVCLWRMRGAKKND
jgi:hypothetical protein